MIEYLIILILIVIIGFLIYREQEIKKMRLEIERENQERRKPQVYEKEESVEDIFEKIVKFIEYELPKDVIRENNTCNRCIKSYKYHSSKKKGRNHWMFLYLHQLNDHVEILLVSGNPHRYSISDPKNITEHCPGNYSSIPRRIWVTPDKIDSGELSYDDIFDLIKQCYDNLDVPRKR